MNVAELLVGGSKFRGWTGLRARRAVDEISGAFSIEYNDRWSPNDEPWYIVPDDECELRFDDEPFITGYVERSAFRIDARSVQLNVEGSSKTGRLIKGSAVHKPGHWRQVTVSTIVSDLLAPYGMDSVVESDSTVSRFALEPSETVARALERLLSVTGQVMTSDAYGTLIVATARNTTERNTLPMGRCVERVLDMDNSQRHSDYATIGQLAGTDEFHGDGLLSTGVAHDPGVKLYSPKVLDTNGPGGSAYLSQRAQYEASVRAGRSRTVELVIAGARDATGRLFGPGNLVDYADPYLGIEAELMISEVEINLSSAGMLTHLRLCPPNAFSLLEIPESAWRRRKHKSHKQLFVRDKLR